MSVYLRAVATANPPFYLTQASVYEVLARRFRLAPEEEDLYRRLLLDGPVRGRHFGMDSADDALVSDPDRLNERFLKFARATGAEAARRALTTAGVKPEDVGGLVVNTCTGYVCPGLSSYLAEDLRLPRRLRALDIAGMGCGGALPNLEAAFGLLTLDGARPILSVAVEICSATLFMGPDPGLIVSNSIFGDGAAAAVLAAGAPARGAGRSRAAKLRGFAAALDPAQREALRYRTENGRLRNQLGLRVPAIGARLAAEALEDLLGRQKASRADIRWWAVHAGGTAVLDQVGERLGLPSDALRYSRDVFRDFGNMSSPSVLFALERLWREGRPAPGDLAVLLAFGAGFSAYAAMLEFV